MVALLIVAAVGVSAVLGIGAGSVAGLVATQPEGPSAPPAIDEDFPSAAKRYLPGVTVSHLAQEWMVKANSWVCAEQTDEATILSGAEHLMECHPADDQHRVYVEIEYDDESQVRMVHASCHFDPGAKTCQSLFSSFAHTLLVGQPDLQEQGEKWAAENADNDDVVIMGGIRLEVSLSPHKIRATPVP